ncbi:hypothetical protein D3C71_1923530 [compost metagenome]
MKCAAPAVTSSSTVSSGFTVQRFNSTPSNSAVIATMAANTHVATHAPPPLANAPAAEAARQNALLANAAKNTLAIRTIASTLSSGR